MASKTCLPYIVALCLIGTMTLEGIYHFCLKFPIFFSVLDATSACFRPSQSHP